MLSNLKNFFQNRILKNLTPAVKFVVIINICVSLLFYFFNELTGYQLQFLFSAYPTYSEHFHVYQLLTFMFVHSIDPSHIVFNVLLLLVFSPFLEKKFGPRAFILIYVVCAWIGYIFINQSYLINKEIVEKRIISTGINIKDIRLNNRHEVDQNYLDKLNEKQSIAVKEYNHITSKTNGASGALFGIVVIYVLLNLKNFKKIFFIALGLYMLYLNLDSFLEPSALTNGSCYAHFGGMLGGFIVVLISLFFDLKKSNLR